MHIKPIDMVVGILHTITRNNNFHYYKYSSGSVNVLLDMFDFVE